MKRYAALIRKLVDATAEADTYGTDVAEILKQRCFNETSIVRQTLMNAVCDPRFKINADVVGKWKEDARRALEQLADLLEKTEFLTEEKAYYILEDFLSKWFKAILNASRMAAMQQRMISPEEQLMLDLSSSLNKLGEACEEMGKESEDAEKKTGNGQSGLVPSDGGEKEEQAIGGGKGQAENTEIGQAEGEGQNSDDVSGREDGTNETNEEEKEAENGSDSGVPSNNEGKDERNKDQAKGQAVGGKQKPDDATERKEELNIKVLEDGFLRKIPPSLIELARRIGRVGENGYHTHGKFQTAGKSDIVGITVGDNLNAVLPSELALLSDSKTQDVFYHNFTAKRLQLFASASQSNKNARKHQNGPVIMCVDTSSSMSGKPMLIAKTLAVTVAIIAWRRKRDVLMVKYSDCYDYIELGHRRSHLPELMKFLRIVVSGGNNENEMFSWLFNEVKPNMSDYETADILCISDFGWTTLSTETENIIKEQKEHGLRFYGLNVESESSSILLYSKGKDIMTPMDICDSVWTYEGGKCIEVKKV